MGICVFEPEPHEADGQAKTPEWAAAICDLTAENIRALARALPGKRCFVSLAWGLQRADHGEQRMWAGLALACVLGQIGKPGLGYAFGYGSTTPVGRVNKLLPWPSLPKIPNPEKGFIPVARIADALLQPGEAYPCNGEMRRHPNLKLVWWCGGNPFHHHQDLRRLERAWEHPETIIVNDHHWTAAARRADIVLPATTTLERDDIMMNRGNPSLFYMSQNHAPLEEARDEFDVFAHIAETLGLRHPFTQGRDANGWLRHLWDQAGQVGEAAGFSLPEFQTFKAQGRFDVPHSNEPRYAFKDFVADPDSHPLATESGKLTLSNDTIARMALTDCPGHPEWLPPVEGGGLQPSEFHLISGQPSTRLHSQNDQGSGSLTAKVKGREVACLHPDAAAALGINEGDVIKLWNARGACLCAVQLNAHIRPDCVSLPTVAWLDLQTADKEIIEVHGNPNALTLDKGCSDQGQDGFTRVFRQLKLGRSPGLAVDHRDALSRSPAVDMQHR